MLPCGMAYLRSRTSSPAKSDDNSGALIALVIVSIVLIAGGTGLGIFLYLRRRDRTTAAPTTVVPATYVTQQGAAAGEVTSPAAPAPTQPAKPVKPAKAKPKPKAKPKAKPNK